VAAHSIFFEVLGDSGFLGLLLFLTVLLLSIIYCGKIIRLCKTDESLRWAADLARALRVCVIVYIAAGAGLSYAYFEGFWILIAIISRLHRTVSQTSRPPTRAELANMLTLAEEPQGRTRNAQVV
jgi:O-antigen ligase